MSFKKTVSAALALLMLAGCSGNGGGSTASSAGSTASSSGKTVTIGMTADLNTMDYHVATDGTSFIFHSLAVGGLVALDSDGQPVPDLAESWDISDDGTVYTFHIREGVTWSNGTPLTAADFVYGWQRLVSPALASEYNFIMETVTVKNAHACVDGTASLDELGVKAIDDLTFEVTLDQPCGFFLGLMAFPSFFPLNQAFFEAEGGDIAAGEAGNFALSVDDFLYVGPYTMTGWEPQTEYTFTKNANYWDAANCTDDVDEIVFRFTGDPASAALAYKNGDIDVVTLTGDLVEQYQDEEGYTRRLTGYAWRLNVNQSTEVLAKNSQYQNLNLRKALSLAIDRDLLATAVLKDGSVGAEGFIPIEFAYGPDGTDFRETAGNLLSYSIDEAKELFDKALSELGVDKISVTLLYETDDPAPGNVATNIQAMWSTAFGDKIEVVLDNKTKKERLALMNELNYEIGLTRWGPDYADPQTFLDLFKSNTSGYNGYYFSDEYDALMDKAETGADAADPAARWADMVAAEKFLIDDMAIIPVYQNGGAMLINPAVSGIEFHNAGVDSYRHIKKS